MDFKIDVQSAFPKEISVTCPACQAPFVVPVAQLIQGNKITCPSCKTASPVEIAGSGG